MPAPYLQTPCLTSHFGVARPITLVIGLRRSGWRRSVDHDRRSLRELGQNQVDNPKAQLNPLLGGPRRSLSGNSIYAIAAGGERGMYFLTLCFGLPSG
jgi:hypothetical protein